MAKNDNLAGLRQDRLSGPDPLEPIDDLSDLDIEDEDIEDDYEDDDGDDTDNTCRGPCCVTTEDPAPTKEVPVSLPVSPLCYTLTNDSVSVVVNGRVCNIQRSASNFEAVRRALLAGDWKAAEESLEIRGNVHRWASGKFTFSQDGMSLFYEGQAVPETFSRRVLDCVARDQSPQSFFNFYERLQRNPSYRSTKQLFDFLVHVNIPILASGHFLAYKGVRVDYTDWYSGNFDNRPGNRHEMPRNKISDDPAVACHEGFHVGALPYAQQLAPRVVVALIDPADVVCVPNDHNAQKVRVCRYIVVGHLGDPLPDDLDQILGMDAVVEPAKPEPTVVKSDVDENLLVLDEKVRAIPNTIDGLMALSMAELRRIAVHDLHIVGAGHIIGGKTAVIAKILEVLLHTNAIGSL